MAAVAADLLVDSTMLVKNGAPRLLAPFHHTIFCSLFHCYALPFFCIYVLYVIRVFRLLLTAVYRPCGGSC